MTGDNSLRNTENSCLASPQLSNLSISSGQSTSISQILNVETPENDALESLQSYNEQHFQFNNMVKGSHYHELAKSIEGGNRYRVQGPPKNRSFLGRCCDKDIEG